jgi:hypothetical protein
VANQVKMPIHKLAWVQDYISSQSSEMGEESLAAWEQIESGDPITDQNLGRVPSHKPTENPEPSQASEDLIAVKLGQVIDLTAETNGESGEEDSPQTTSVVDLTAEETKPGVKQEKDLETSPLGDNMDIL